MFERTKKTNKQQTNDHPPKKKQKTTTTELEASVWSKEQTYASCFPQITVQRTGPLSHDPSFHCTAIMADKHVTQTREALDNRLNLLQQCPVWRPQSPRALALHLPVDSQLCSSSGDSRPSRHWDDVSTGPTETLGYHRHGPVTLSYVPQRWGWRLTCVWVRD